MSQRYLISVSLAEDKGVSCKYTKFNELDTHIIKALKTEEAIAILWSALVMMQSLN